MLIVIGHSSNSAAAADESQSIEEPSRHQFRPVIETEQEFQKAYMPSKPANSVIKKKYGVVFGVWCPL